MPHRLVRFAALAAAGALLAPPALAAKPSGENSHRRLSDRDLLRYARSSFDKRKMMWKHVLLGRHRGTLVVADFPCSDVCPTYTKRIIHYDVDASGCRRVRGVVVEELVPFGIGVRSQAFCKPAVLAGPARAE